MADNHPPGDPDEVPETALPPTEQFATSPGMADFFGLPDRPPANDAMVGSDIGGVTIIRVIAEGGMGRVYEGRQHKPDRAVAVKIMRPGVASTAMLRRFEYEAEILGRLTHPGIAQIFTVGTHRLRGIEVPYFVMEYIPNARTITRYATDLNLPTDARLRLFRKVCDAVAHGHQKGVIHRDLKPGNILVDADGNPRVIDFGVARSTNADLALTTMNTAVGQIIGTVQYMSPEQFAADPADIDVRADVYALGVVLYELLTGSPPYDLRRKAIYEAARVVREEEPRRLSSFNRMLRKDLEAVALKCLDKNRTHRYASASDLGEDIRRYLANEPVSAGMPTFLRGLWRLARRHKAPAIAAVVVFASLVVAVVGIGIFAWKAEKQRLALQVERDRAAALQQTAEEQKTLAETQTTAAGERLYRANLYRLENLLAGDAGSEAWELLQETRGLVGRDAPEPLELAILAASQDNSLVSISGTESSTPAFVVGPDGGSIAVECSGRTLQLVDVATGRDVTRDRLGLTTAKAVAFSVDGALAAVVDETWNARLRETTTGREILSIPLASDLPAGQSPQRLEAIVFGPDGGTMAAVVRRAPAESRLGLWKVSTGALIASSTVENPSTGFAFSPDGGRLLVAVGPLEREGGARLIDTATGESQRIPGYFTAVAFHPSGKRFVTADGTGHSTLWDGETCAKISPLPDHTALVSWLAFTPDGAKVLTASRDCRIHVSDAGTGKALAEWTWHPKADAIALSPEGRLLAAATDSGGLAIWDVGGLSPVTELRGGGKEVCSIAFDRTERTVAAGSRAGVIRVWDIAASREVAVLRGHAGAIRGLAFAGDGRRLVSASGDGSVRLWDTSSAQSATVRLEDGKQIVSVAYSPDGAVIATGSLDRSSQLWDAATLEQVAVFPEGGRCMAFTPDGSGFAAGSSSAAAPGVTIYDVESRLPRTRLLRVKAPVSMMRFGGQGDLMTVHSDGSIRVWNPSTGESRVEMSFPANVVGALTPAAVAWSPDGTRIAMGEPGGLVRVWDAVSGSELPSLRGHKAWVIAVHFNGDGSRLLSSALDGTARLWDMASSRDVAVLDRCGPAMIAFAGGDTFAIGSFAGEMILCDAVSGERKRTVKAHTNRILEIAFDKTGGRVGTVSLDRSVRLWDGVSGEKLLDIPGRDGLAVSLAFGPDGRRLATIEEGAVFIWGMSSGELFRARHRPQAESPERPRE
jgi:WD40 repeat protein